MQHMQGAVYTMAWYLSVCPGQTAVKQVCVCVCICLSITVL